MSARIQKSISIFLPAYNEEENIEKVIRNINDYLKVNFNDYEIIVINDVGKDNTAGVVEEVMKELPQLKLINRPKNLGYAAALRTGFKNSTKELIFYTDSDGQFNINELDRFLPLIDSYAIITGYRLKRRDPVMRLWMANIYKFVFRIIFGLRVRDIDCAFKIFKSEIFKKISLIPTIKTGVINAEIYLKAIKCGYNLFEVGVTHFPRLKGISSNEIADPNGKFFAFVKPHVYMDFLVDTISLWKNLRKIK